MGKSKDLATGASYQDQTESDARYVNTSGDTMTGDLSVANGGVHVTSPSGIEGLIVDADQGNTAVSGRIVLKNNTSASSVYYSDSLGWTFHTGTILGTTSGTQRMYLTPQGYLRTPYQPVFCARRNSQATVSTNTKLSFPTTDVNVGSHWNGSRFTAPVAGNYYFSLNLRLGHTGKLRVFVVDIYKNGSVFRQRAFGNGGGNDYDGTSGSDHTYVSGSVVVYLGANDYLELYTGNEITYSGNLYVQNSGDSSFFSGHLIG
jgi:hypothetical protein